MLHTPLPSPLTCVFCVALGRPRPNCTDRSELSDEFFSVSSSPLLTAIGSVTTVSASYSCSTGMATVSWDLVSEADRYRATATGSDGSVRTCNSTSTSCAINSLACGQQYVVTVTAITDQCESISNVTQLFETGESGEHLRLWNFPAH